MITLQPEIVQGGDIFARPRVRVLFAGTGPATFLAQGVSYELEPDILMPPVTVQQGLWVVPAPVFPASLPGEKTPKSLLQVNPNNLLAPVQVESWPSEAPADRLLRYLRDVDTLVLITCPEYEAGWRAAIGDDSAPIAVLRGLQMPDGSISDARIEVPEGAADLLADLPRALADLAGRDSIEADEQQVELLSTAQPMLQVRDQSAQIAFAEPQEAHEADAGAVGATPSQNAPQRKQEAAPQPVQDSPTAKVRKEAPRVPPPAPRLSQAVAPAIKAPAKAPIKVDTNPNPWERTEAGALNAVAHHARCEGHGVERQSTSAGGLRFRAAPSCRILAEVAQPDGEADDGVLLG